MSEATEEQQKPEIYDTREDLVRGEAARLNDPGFRAYRIRAEGDPVYVVANSPGQAALAVCEVERVPPKELMAAAFQVIVNDKDAK